MFNSTPKPFVSALFIYLSTYFYHIYIYIYSILGPVKPELGVIPSAQEIIHE